MRPDEVREMGSEDIVARVRELEEERFRLKFRSATEPLEDPLRMRVIRKDLARLKTILRERELGIKREVEGGKREAEKKKSERRPAKKGAAKTKAR
jgi:large subunit ribosomal protein L29